MDVPYGILPMGNLDRQPAERAWREDHDEGQQYPPAGPPDIRGVVLCELSRLYRPKGVLLTIDGKCHGRCRLRATIMLPPQTEREEAMSASFNSHDGIAYPTDLKLLNDVFSRVCREHGLRESSPAAEDVGRAAMSLFSSGVDDEAELFTSLEEFMRRKSGA